jgi:hypothetical protein
MVAGLAGVAPAAVLYRQDFQKRAAPEWTSSSPTGMALTTYQGNVSLKFAGHASVRTTVAVGGKRDLIVRMKVAALGLGAADACYGEASLDGGATWRTVIEVAKGQDDGGTLHPAAVAVGESDDDKLILRLRADVSGASGACWGDDIEVDGDPTAPVRGERLEAGVLTGAAPLTGLSDARMFAKPPLAVGPASRFEGHLALRPAAAPDGIAVLRDDYARRGADSRLKLPDLDIDLVADGDRLIPARRGPIPSASPDWEWVVEPGSVWSNPGDGAFSRASLPVALEERNANCVHNGALVLLFRADGTVSRAAVQFDADTCLYSKFDAWSLVAAAYRPGPIAGAQAIVARDRATRAARLPLRPLAELAATHPGLEVAALSRAAGPFAVWGPVDEGTHYVGGCPTRAGPDPACDERDLPSYSTAKSIVGALALMRLERLRPGIAGEKVADHVPACAKAGGWGDVRLVDLADMASGHYVSAGEEADENSSAMNAFFLSTTAADKTAFACGQPRREKPGGRFVYHTADSFLLGVALADVLRKDFGQDKDLYDDLVRPIWARLTLSPTLDVTRRTLDAAAQPFTGWGLTYHRDDLVRAVRFLWQGGRISGEPQLDPALLEAAMQRAHPGAGLTAGSPRDRYLHGFWARDIAPLIGCPHPLWTPYLFGYGGIEVVLFPNDVQFYAFNDEDWFDWSAAVAEVNKIRSLCA